MFLPIGYVRRDENSKCMVDKEEPAHDSSDLLPGGNKIAHFTYKT